MKKGLYFIAFVFCLMGCTTNTAEPEAVKPIVSKKDVITPESLPSLKSKIRTVKETSYFKEDKILSSVARITTLDDKPVYKSKDFVWFNSESNDIEVDPGTYKIQFRCDNNGKFNYNWIKAKIEENRNYVVYCLKETQGKTMFGLENIISFLPFISFEEDLTKDMVANQKIVDTPSQDILDKPVAEGKTRLIIYNVKSTLMGFDNSNSYKIFVNGVYLDSVQPKKYIAIDVENGESNVEIRFVDVFTFKSNLHVNFEGGIKYIACSNGASSAIIELKPEMPEDFKKVYKPQHPFKP